MSCPSTTGCPYDWGCDKCPHETKYDELSSDELKQIIYICKCILANRKDYLRKESTDD